MAAPKPNSRLGRLETRIEDRGTTGAERAAGIEQDVDAFRRGFNATDAARETARAAYADFAEDHARGIRDLRGQQVSMGRLRTGFAQEDEDELTQDFQDRLARELARGAFTAASLDLRNIEGFSGEGIEARRASDEAMTGFHDILQARRNQNQQRRRGLLGYLGGGLGAIAGGIFGGPGGAAIGARIGGGLGASI